MQVVSTQFDNRAKGYMRPLSWSLLMSFPRNFIDTIDFFTIEVSTIGGDDIIKGEGDVVQEWDKYEYSDYSGRIISMEWTRQEDYLSSMAMSTADITLDNSDGYFTPNGGSVIEDFILPYRPIKLFAGFGGENIPVFIGLTEKMPDVDEKNKTVKFHCIDFIYSLYNRPLTESVMMEEARTDEVLDELLQLAGLTSNQYNLDIGFNIIHFAYFPKDTKLGDAITELMEAEMGRFYLDELGVIQFKNRQNFSQNPVYAFSPNNIITATTSKQDDITNVVEIKANVREVQANQKFWELQSPILIPAGSSVDIWADFEDPVTDVDEPEYVTTAVTSSYTTNELEDGSGANRSADITLDSFSRFAQSYKMTFENTGSYNLYITTLELFATPAKVVKELYVREQDDTSVNKYDERPVNIDNNFISREDEAYSKAIILLTDYAEYGSVLNLDVKGNMALQLNDCIDVILPDVGIRTYVITKMSNKMMNGKFSQSLTVKVRDPQHYFTIEVSTIGGTDVIAP